MTAGLRATLAYAPIPDVFTVLGAAAGGGAPVRDVVLGLAVGTGAMLAMDRIVARDRGGSRSASWSPSRSTFCSTGCC